jgi:hypothetical protein
LLVAAWRFSRADWVTSLQLTDGVPCDEAKVDWPSIDPM